jgi:hypothetical protein
LGKQKVWLFLFLFCSNCYGASKKTIDGELLKFTVVLVFIEEVVIYERSGLDEPSNAKP